MATKKDAEVNATHPLIGFEFKVLRDGPIPKRQENFDYSIIRCGAYFSKDTSNFEDFSEDVLYTFRLVRIQKRPVVQEWEDV